MNLVIRNTMAPRLHRARPQSLHAGHRLAGRRNGAVLMFLLACGAVQGGLLLVLAGLATLRSLMP